MRRPEFLVRQKFTRHPALAKALVATGTAVLAEGTRRGDQFWGVDLETMVGANQLGGILMDVRAELASGRGKGPFHVRRYVSGDAGCGRR